MPALDSRVALALMAKADLVFGGERKLLCFPIGAASMPPSRLDFFPEPATAESRRHALLALSDFSTMVDMLPSGRVWENGTSARASLTRAYRDVLETAEVAAVPERSEDNTRLHDARAVLTRTLENGSEVDSDRYAAYKHHRDVHLLAAQRYNAARASGEVSPTPEERDAWTHEEPILRAAQEQAAVDWSVTGARAAIEEALAVIATVTTRTPIRAWSEWSVNARQGVRTETSLTGQPFWPTYISPANAALSGWQSMTLTAGEIQDLQSSAPAEIRARLGTATSGLDVIKLEFEFSSAGLTRPWFDPMVFSSRFWRPRAESPIEVSNGAPPFRGECPLYASGIVFFRNVRATLKADVSAVHAAATRMTDARVNYGMFHLDVARIAIAKAAPVREVPPTIVARASARRFMVADRARARRLTERNPDLMLVATTHPAGVPPAPATATIVETEPGDIFVLAFICSIVPPSPDPDPALAWPS